MNRDKYSLDHCLKCSICHTQCPVVANFIEFSGPKHLGPEFERLRLARAEKEPLKVDKILSYCTNCKRCDMACPHGVKPSYYNLKNREKVEESISEKFRDWILAHNVWWGKMATVFPGFSNFALQFPFTKFGMSMVGIANRNLPAYNKKSFKIRQEEKKKKVLYFPGCYASFNEPEIIQGTVDILEAFDYEVKLMSHECCGTPLISNGLLMESQGFANRNSDKFIEYIDKGYKIVTTCPSCGLSLKEEYKDIIPGEKALKVSQNVWELFELLEQEEIEPFIVKDKEKIAYYHLPCHLKVQGMGSPSVDFLKRVAIEDLITEDTYCCGLSGTYGFKKEKHSLSMEIGSLLFQSIKESKTNLVITECGTCKVQIRDGTGIEVKHPVLVLREYLKTQ